MAQQRTLTITLPDFLNIENAPGYIWAVFALAIAILSANLITLLFRRWSETNPGIGPRWALRVTPMIAPMIHFVLLAVGLSFFQKEGMDTRVSQVLIDICLTWLTLSAIFTLTKSMVKTIFAAALIIPHALLSIFGMLDSVVGILNSFSLQAGKFHISAYHFLRFVITIVFLSWVVGALTRGVHFSLQNMRYFRANTRQLFLTLSKVVIYAVAFLVVLDALGIDLTAFAIFGGALGVGMGLGLRNIVANFIGGIILLMERSVAVGDMIEIPQANITGIVKHTGHRYTLIEGFDKREIMIPNEDFMTQRIVNWTYSSPRGLLKIPLIVSYDTDLEKARDIILEAARSHPRCLKEPPPSCLLNEFTDQAVNLNLYVWIGDIRENKTSTQSEILMSVWKKLTENHIGIPHQERRTQLKPAIPADDGTVDVTAEKNKII